MSDEKINNLTGISFKLKKKKERERERQRDRLTGDKLHKSQETF